MDNIRYNIDRQLLTYNPKLYGKDIFIKGIDEQAIHILRVLTWYGYRIEGFVDEKFAGEKFLNKRIIHMDNLNKIPNAVCVDELCAPFYCTEKLERYAFVLNDAISHTEVALYGKGISGKATKQFLEEKGVKVKCYLDSFVKDDNSYEDSLKVYGKKYLENSPRNLTVIISSCAYFEEIYESVQEYTSLNLIYCGELFGEFFLMKKDWLFGFINNNTMNSTKFFYWFNNFSQMNLFLFGKSEFMRNLYEFLKLFDFNVKGVIVEEDVDKIQNNWLVDEIFQIEDILYFDNSVVIFEKYNFKAVKKLQLLSGRNKNYYVLDRYECGNYYERSNVIDEEVGYSYLSSCKYPGFTEIGHYDSSEIKVILLGGSTTDETLFSQKSWGDYLYELNNKIGILNGGVAGYNSSDEIIKLARDVLLLKPDLVIVYDGVNECCYPETKEFYSIYRSHVFKYVAESIIDRKKWPEKFGGDREKPQISLVNGVEMKTDPFDRWYRHIRIMDSMMREFNIRGYFFLQPYLSSKKDITFSERVFTIIDDYDWDKKIMDRLYRGFKEELDEKYNNIYCLSNIFDSEQGDIYIDHLHVNERGNWIIANEIFKRIPELHV